MFVQHRNLTQLSLPVQRVDLLYRSGNDVQLALPGLTPQLASAFLLKLKETAKGQVVIGLHLRLSQTNIFYVTDRAQLSIEQADLEFEAGIEFAESMGFVLFDVELSQKTAPERETYWQSLPICRFNSGSASQSKADAFADLAAFPAVAPGAKTADVKPLSTTAPLDTHAKRQALKEQLGQFFASL